MDWGFRTLVRVFLLVGGLALLVIAAVEGTPLNMGIGALAAVLGAFGLWWEYTRAGDLENQRL